MILLVFFLDTAVYIMIRRIITNFAENLTTPIALHVCALKIFSTYILCFLTKKKNDNKNKQVKNHIRLWSHLL